MTTHKEALKLALEALEDNQHLVADNERHAYVMEYNDLIEKCKEALAQPEQKPVAWRHKGQPWEFKTDYCINLPNVVPDSWEPLYTTPPQRKPLMDEHPLMVFAKECALGAYQEHELADAANKAIEAADRIIKENT